MRYLDAVNQLKKKPAKDGVSKNLYEEFVAVHWNHKGESHGLPAFLPWHRVFLRRFEQALQEINPDITLPWWDTGLDSQEPHKSSILSSQYFGSNGDPFTHCVVDGAFANWNRSLPQEGCLQRHFDGGSIVRPFYGPEALDQICRLDSYDAFRRGIEGPAHARVHVGINGDMAQMYSPNDPIFFLHHANIDRLWFLFQKQGERAARDYSGDNFDGTFATVEDELIPWKLKVKDVLFTEQGDLCYV
ncbi:hypothetical protein HK102_012325 [Quaeritorhiza haematococci]|nr:hypothetical protein HK102_012325 [Quaeritorhiza haematococci]